MTGRQIGKAIKSDNRALKFLLIGCWLPMLALPVCAATLVWDAGYLDHRATGWQWDLTNVTANTFGNGTADVTWTDGSDA